MAIKRYKPEQIVTLLRQIEVAPVSREFWRRRVSARLRAPPVLLIAMGCEHSQ
jgi:hypothetical protein